MLFPLGPFNKLFKSSKSMANLPSFKERTLSFMRLFLSPEFGTFVFLALVFFVALAERLEPLNYPFQFPSPMP